MAIRFQSDLILAPSSHIRTGLQVKCLWNTNVLRKMVSELAGEMAPEKRK
jgi:hypothetical protein